MRMWLVDPSTMCDQHLKGEHCEIHMLVGSFLKGRSIRGHLDKGNLEPALLYERHAELAAEMLRRRMKHEKPLPVVDASIFGVGYVDRVASERELRRRCVKCRSMTCEHK